MSGRTSEAHHSAAITRILEIVPYAAAIREHVGEIAASPAFKGSRRGQELLKHITPADVAWVSDLLGRLSDRQWSDAFRAGGYTPEITDRFIGRLGQKIAEGCRLGECGRPSNTVTPAGPRHLLVGVSR